MKIELIKPSKEFELQYYDFINEWINNNEDITPYSVRLLYMDYKTWLDNTIKNECKETCSSDWVPSSTYFLVSENRRIIGAVNIRHELNDYLFNFAGHIGYGIRPSERRKGYATKMLELALPLAKSLKLNKVLITCDKNNIASAKTIQKNGGVLENEVTEDGVVVQRYWIKL